MAQTKKASTRKTPSSNEATVKRTEKPALQEIADTSRPPTNEYDSQPPRVPNSDQG